MNYIPLILSGVCLNALAQVFLKKGMLMVGYFDFSAVNIAQIIFKVAANPFIILGLGCYMFSVALWLLVLSRVEVSFAYPFLSIGYIITAIIGYTIFHETLSINKLTGIFFICLGVVFISKR